VDTYRIYDGTDHLDIVGKVAPGHRRRTRGRIHQVAHGCGHQGTADTR
jgi:hypothetical protein